jgi:transposase
MVVVFVRGVEQAEFVSRLRGVSGDRVLLIPVDVGKRSAMSMVANQLGEVIVDPFEFALDRPGVDLLLDRVADAEETADAVVVRFGIEAAGHYHRPLTAALQAEPVEVVELHPGAVHKARAEMGQRRLKSDLRDLAAMVELMARGTGRSSRWEDNPIAIQAVWSAHRRRKVKARVPMGLQILSQLDLVFPGFGDCFKDVIRAKGGHVILRHCPDPVRIQRMGPEGLRAFVADRGVRMARSKAALIVAVAQRALLVPDAERRARMRALQADLAIYDRICGEIDKAEAELAKVIGDTPAGVLTSLPGVGIPRASAYGAALGDPERFASAGAAWRYSGLVPVEHESAGKRRPGMRISREGSTPLREAILEIGKGLSDHHPEFKAYKRRKIAAGKKKTVAAVAVAHRAHRLAFAMIRAQTVFDPQRWNESTVGGSVTAATGDRHDVTRPPPITMTAAR